MSDTEKYPIAIYNGPVVTVNGLFRLCDISMEDAKELVKNNKFISAVGHESTAELLSDILEVAIPVNRIQFCQEPGQKAIIFKLHERPPEGIIYNRQEIEKIGYCLKLIERIE
jgi:hypothetical protein